MNLEQKVERRFNQLKTAGFNSFGELLQDFWRFFDSEPILYEIGKRLHESHSSINDYVRVFLQSRLIFKPKTSEESVAKAYEILRWLSVYASDGMFRGGLAASVYPTEFRIIDYNNSQSEVDKNLLSTFKETYLETFCHYIEEQLEKYEMINKTEDNLENKNSTVIQNFNAPVASVQTGNHMIANVNQNIGQNLSEILELLATLKREFRSLPDGDREKAIEVVDALAVEVQSENPSKGKVKAFLSSVKDFAVKTGTDATSKVVVELIKGQIGIG